MKIIKLTAIISVFVLLFLLLIHSLNSINQDIGRHLKSGQIIWETKQVYKTNLFSFTEPNQPFINHHWFSEVVFYLLYLIAGLKGLILFKALTILLSFFIIWLAIKKKVGIMPFVVSSLIFMPVLIYRSDVRPEIFSYLFLSVFLFAIFRAKYQQEEKWLYILPLVQILWTNMHIYFALGPGLLFLFSIDRFINSRPAFKKTALLFIVTTAATLINPNFIYGALEPLNILRHYGYSIVENQSILFLRDYGTQIKYINIFEASLIVLIISFLICFKNKVSDFKNKISFELMASVVFLIMAIKMIRNFGIYALLAIPVVAFNLSSIRIKSQKIRIGLTIVICALIFLVIYNTPNNKIYTALEDGKHFGFGVPDGSSKAVEFIKQNNIKGPMFNNFDIGSFLIWKMYPEEKVFVDGRPEAYSVDFFEKIYKPMQENPELWQKFSEQYKINYVIFGYQDITPWAKTFMSYISQNKNWPLVYMDSSTVIFLKKTAANEKLIQKLSFNLIQ